MKSVFRLLAVVAVLFIMAAPAMAQTGALTAADKKAIAAASNNRFGPGIGIGLSVLGIGVGLGMIGYAALSGVARQPEQTGTLRGLMILLAALVEGAGIIGILFSLAMVFLG
jgi:F0F1-type ATP synthase membrane subunit c/vacuolar-type H+-ATPase subunit K